MLDAPKAAPPKTRTPEQIEQSKQAALARQQQVQQQRAKAALQQQQPLPQQQPQQRGPVTTTAADVLKSNASGTLGVSGQSCKHMLGREMTADDFIHVQALVPNHAIRQARPPGPLQRATTTTAMQARRSSPPTTGATTGPIQAGSLPNLDLAHVNRPLPPVIKRTLTVPNPGLRAGVTDAARLPEELSAEMLGLPDDGGFTTARGIKRSIEEL